MSPESASGLLNQRERESERVREREQSLSKQTNNWETTVKSQLDDCQIEIEIEIETVSRRMKKLRQLLRPAKWVSREGRAAGQWTV